MTETYDLGPLDRIPVGEGRAFELGARRVAVFRTRGGELHATQATCPHRGGPLADGLLGERCVVCPLHGHRFDLATGSAAGHACGPIETYEASVGNDGRVRVRIAAERTHSFRRP
jgi:nitrite reductase (NADH) small subunit